MTSATKTMVTPGECVSIMTLDPAAVGLDVRGDTAINGALLNKSWIPNEE